MTHPTPGPGSAQPLTPLERDILAFEADWVRHAGAKDDAVRARFDLAAADYYRLLNALLDRAEAEHAAPVLVRRLRRQRRHRQEARSARRSTGRPGTPGPSETAGRPEVPELSSPSPTL